MAYYKVTFKEDSNILKSIESSDTQSSEFYLPLWVVNQLKPRISTQSDVDTLYAQWQLLEQQRLDKELAKQQELADMASTQPTDTNENM